MQKSCRAPFLSPLQAIREAEPPGVRHQLEQEKEVIMTTSKKDASTAGKLLSSAKTPKKVKSVAGSDLAQAKGSSKKKK